MFIECKPTIGLPESDGLAHGMLKGDGNNEEARSTAADSLGTAIAVDAGSHLPAAEAEARKGAETFSGDPRIHLSQPIRSGQPGSAPICKVLAVGSNGPEASDRIGGTRLDRLGADALGRPAVPEGVLRDG